MKKIKYLILIFIPLILSGCYNYKELNQLGIASSFSIDYKDGNYDVIVELINPTKQQNAANANNSPFIIYEKKAPSIQEAFRNIVLESPKQVYASQVEIIILSEEVVTNHLKDVLDFFSRDPETRTEVKILLAKTDESTKAITIQTLLTDFSSSNIVESLELQSNVLGVTYSVTLNDLVNMYLNPYLEITLPTVILKGDNTIGDNKENTETSVPLTSVEINGTAIFKDNKLMHTLDIDNSKLLSLINGELKETVINYPYKDGYIVFEPNRIKTSKKANIKKNTVEIEITGSARINSIDTNINLEDDKEIEKIKNSLNKSIESDILSLFNTIREKYNTDAFGFKELYYKTDANYYKNKINNWYEDIFPKLKLNVTSNITLYEKGNTLGGMEYERENN